MPASLLKDFKGDAGIHTRRCRRVPHQASRFFFSSDHKDFNSAVVSAGHSTVM